MTLTWAPTFSDAAEWSPDWGDASPDVSVMTFGTNVQPVISSSMNYDLATNKPCINGVELVGNKTNSDIGIKAMSNFEIEALLSSFI